MDIQTQILSNKGLVLEKSRLNYGIKGLHSIVIEQNQGRYTRLMLTTPDHEMWCNHCGLLGESMVEPMTMAIHTSKINQKIYPLHNSVWVNIFAKERKKPNRITPPEQEFNQYFWKNPFEFINTSGFESKGTEVLLLKLKKILNVNDDILLNNTDLRTFYVEKNECAVWLVQEFQGIGLYDRLVYSNTDLTTWKFEDFYQTPTPQQINDLLNIIEIKI